MYFSRPLRIELLTNGKLCRCVSGCLELSYLESSAVIVKSLLVIWPTMPELGASLKYERRPIILVIKCVN